MSKSLIITCINLGASHSANYAIYEILEQGLATSASLMVPCPWAREAGKHPSLNKADIGVQLTLNAEFESYRWGPITLSPSLLDGDGGFPRTANDLWEHADPAEVRRECLSQIERASLWGIKISHLGSHLDALLPRPEYFDIYLELSMEFKIPLRLPDKRLEADYGFPFRELAGDSKIPAPDQILELNGNSNISEIVSSLENAATTELLCSPLLDTPEARTAYSDNFKALVRTRQKLEELHQAIDGTNIQITNWTEFSANS